MTYEDKKRTRVLLNASDLREILSRHPEVEMELLNKAVPQLTKQLRQRALRQTAEDIYQTVKREIVKNGIGSVSELAQMIDVLIADRMPSAMTKVMIESANARVDEWFKKNEKRIDDIIASKIALVVEKLVKV